MRQKATNALVVALFISAAAPGVALGSTQPPVPVVGGYRSADTANMDIRAAARFAVAAVEGRRARLRSIERAEQQVVAGVNYRIELTTTRSRRWRVTVYQPLRGRMQLTSRERLPRR